MQLIRADASIGVDALSSTFTKLLRHDKKVLWLISGGSNIPITVQAMATIPDQLTPQLTILLVDERYGPIGHKNSNAEQLVEKGFDPKAALFKQVLTGSSKQETVASYNREVKARLSDNDLIVGQLGIGEDGHIAGILPHSLAIESTAYVVGYEAADYGYRITLTITALALMSQAFVFAYGKSKLKPLKDLRDASLPLDVQPAQILKAIPKAYVYNDQLEGEQVK